MLWSLAFLLLLALISRSGLRVTARQMQLLSISAVLLAVNWGTFIWAVSNGYVVEASLGYFINPLVSVALGVLVLSERLSGGQKIAVVVAGVAVVVLTASYGRPPWIALTLAFSFGLYGLVRKKAAVGTIPALTVETALQAPFAVVYLGWLATTAGITFGHGVGHSLWLASAGVATTVPLLLFGAAALRLPLVTLGLLQYIAPILQFATGVLYFGEHMPLARWLGFALVWAGLAVFTVDVVRQNRRGLG